MDSIITNSKVLITGGAGFIGSNLVKSLIGENEIVVVDDLSMGKIENLPNAQGLSFYKHSITDFEFMKDLLIKWNFDYIFLLAAVASVADTIERPAETHVVNQDADINVLEVIRSYGLKPKRLLFASSAAVYGNNLTLPKKENSIVDPLSPYAIDKFATERFVIDYGNLYNIPTAVTRFFNVYGKNQNPDSPYSGVLSIVVEAAKGDGVFNVYGDGAQTRDFVYVDDVVSALVVLAQNKKAIGNVYNVAYGKERSLNDVIANISSIIGESLHPVYKDARVGDIKRSVADISKIKSLGYAPQFDLETGLKEYLDGELDHLND
ncbi:GDP-mannose 4,6-dehydratase [Levilactobacillus brevis]|uniref:GDP-mannose 4,6-dehydratase n=1 Tax=Levilactobacillus brevis TaxID=1580 RepID=UPI001CDC1F4B|nr:GDP-mannose 4,6-dehydratase [Levilactobacillus brevis]MCB5231662.1 GDP-mannose 4,6-dehydratase [Levilactobacillus brevis]MCX7511661.1 GDP-mannose 4,6-dehydratase [Levilactobacillus brevis]